MTTDPAAAGGGAPRDRDALFEALREGSAAGRRAAVDMVTRWLGSRPGVERYRAALTPPVMWDPQVPDTVLVTGGDTEPVPDRVRVGAIAEAASAYAHLRRWAGEATGTDTVAAQELDPITVRTDLVASTVAAQACTPERELFDAAAAQTLVTGTLAEAGYLLGRALARVAARAFAPGQGTTVHALHPVRETLTVGDPGWDEQVRTVTEALAPYLSARDPHHMHLGQVAAVMVLWQYSPQWPVTEILAQVAQHPESMRRRLHPAHPASVYPSAVELLDRREAVMWQMAFQGAIDSHRTPHGWAHLVDLAQQAATPPVRPQVDADPPEEWARAWEWATVQVDRDHPHWPQDTSWERYGCAALLALARYTIVLAHPGAGERELLARVEHVLADHRTFYARVPPMLRAAGHDLDTVNPEDAVSATWGWVHREWEDPGPGAPRYLGWSRSVGWGGAGSAVHTLLTLWAHPIVHRSWARAVGAIPAGGTVLDLRGRRGRVVAALIDTDPSQDATAAVGAPAWYQVVWEGRSEPELVEAHTINRQ